MVIALIGSTTTLAHAMDTITNQQQCLKESEQGGAGLGLQSVFGEH